MLISGNLEHLSCVTDHSHFEAVCLNETMLRATLIRPKHSSQGKCHFKNLPKSAFFERIITMHV